MPHRSTRFRVGLAYLTGLRLVVNTAQRFVYPFLPVIARGLGIPLEQAGLLISARWAAGLSTPVLMTVASRGRARRKLMVMGLGLFITGAAVTAASNAFAGALTGFVLMGVAKPVFDVSSQAYVADRVPYGQRGRYLGILELTWAGGLLVGAPLAGWMIARSGWQAPFWGLAGVALVATAVGSRILDHDRGDVHGSEGRLRFDRISTSFLVVAALYAAAAEMMFVVLGAWLEGFGLSLVALGGVTVFIGLAELSGEGAMVLFSDRIGKRRSIVAGIIIAAVGFTGFAVVETSLVLGMGAVMIAYFGFELAIVSGIPYATELHPHARARFLAWLVVAWAVGRSLGAAVGPWLFSGYGLATLALIAAILNVVAAGVFVGTSPLHRVAGPDVVDPIGATQEED